MTDELSKLIAHQLAEDPRFVELLGPPPAPSDLGGHRARVDTLANLRDSIARVLAAELGHLPACEDSVCARPAGHPGHHACADKEAGFCTWAREE